jgi:hypothetical protein
MNFIEAVFISFGVILGLMMIVPWIAIGMEAYWSWCLKVQRRVKKWGEQQ